MDEFLKLATSQLGLSEAKGKQATSGLLGFLQDQADGSDFSQLLDKLPGANAMLQSAEAESGSKGGGLLGAVGNLVGGKLGGSLGLVSTLQGAGLDTGGASRFVTMFFDFAKQKAGSDLIARILQKVPEVQKLLGGAGA